MTVEVDDQEFLIERVRKHLKSTGSTCVFASAFAKRRGIYWLVVRGAFDPGLIDSTFDASGAEGLAAGVVFPDLRSPAEVASLLLTLSAGDRWRVERCQWRQHEREDLLVTAIWTNAAGIKTSVLGLAPFGSMPVTRRAPFVTLMAWTGERLNPFKHVRPLKDDDGMLSFLDMPMPPSITNEAEYGDAWDLTRADAKRVQRLLREGASHPKAAFCLPLDCEPQLSSLLDGDC